MAAQNGILIGLTGKQGTGKDTVGEILIRDYGFKRHAFADPVREMALAINPWIVERDEMGDQSAEVRLADVVAAFGWDQAKRLFPETRRLLQAIGTDAVRNIIGQNTWIDLAMSRVSEELVAGNRVIITDVRFRNEAEAIQLIGGDVIKLIRDGVAGSNTTHVSETELDSIVPDVEIDNNHTVADLEREVASVLVDYGIYPEEVSQ